MPKFDVEVTRAGYGFATISVEAATQAEAEELALDEAGNHSYSEKASEYSLTHGAAADSPEQPIHSLSDDALLAEIQRRGMVGTVWRPSDLVECGHANNQAHARFMLAQSKAWIEKQATELGWGIIQQLAFEQKVSGERTDIALRMDLFGEILDCSAPAAGAEIDAGRIDEAMALRYGRVTRLAIEYPDRTRHGMPAYESGDGAREWVADQGFMLAEDFELSTRDTGDDSPPVFTVTLNLPIEALRDPLPTSGAGAPGTDLAGAASARHRAG